MCKEAGVNISYRVADMTHRIGAAYVDNKKKREKFYSVIYNFLSQNHGL